MDNMKKADETKDSAVLSTPAERLKAARIAQGYDRPADFIKKHNLVQASYSLHESGKRKFNFETAERYAAKLNVSVDYLLTGSQPKKVDVEDLQWLKPAAELTAGRWLSVDGPAPVPIAHPHIRIPADSRYPRELQRAYLINGWHGGCAFPSGSVLNALTTCDNPQLLPVGTLLVVRQLQDHGKIYELTLRVIKETSMDSLILALPAEQQEEGQISVSSDLTYPLIKRSRTVDLIGRVINVMHFL